jgi:hypothetical protein
MSYTDQKYFNITQSAVVLNSNAGTSTSTASGQAVTTTSVMRLPKFIRRSQINAIRVAIDSAPTAGYSAQSLVFLNGTATLGVVNIGASAVGASVDAVITSANSVVPAGIQPTVNFIGTATASGSAPVNGNYSVYWEVEPLPA